MGLGTLSSPSSLMHFSPERAMRTLESFTHTARATQSSAWQPHFSGHCWTLGMADSTAKKRPKPIVVVAPNRQSSRDNRLHIDVEVLSWNLKPLEGFGHPKIESPHLPYRVAPNYPSDQSRPARCRRPGIRDRQAWIIITGIRWIGVD